MGFKNFVCCLLLVAAGGSFALSQTLAEIAKKERERRESLKGKKGIVVTNADLAKLKKKPALEIPPAEPEQGTEGQSSEETAPGSPPQAPEPVVPPALAGAPSGSQNEVSLKALQERWEKAKEYVELLTLKMGALWQEFSSLDNPSAREAIRLAIAETFLKLQNAQEEEAKARQELEKLLGQIKKDSVPSLWIR